MKQRNLPFTFTVLIVGISILAILLMSSVPAMANSSTPYDLPDTSEPPDQVQTPALYDVPLALSLHDHFFFTRPVTLKDIDWPTSDFRFGYFDTKTDSLHTGIDIVSSIGEPVLAAGDGEVIYADYGLITGTHDEDDPYGIAVMIRHTFGFEGKTLYTVYAHLQKTLVEDGQMVEAGQPIGTVGITGSTTGPHVHFEVRIQNGEDAMVQNPELWMAPPLGHGVLAGRIQAENGHFLASKSFTLKSLETGKTWKIMTYSQDLMNRHFRDGYFSENFVLHDLPEGSYEISTYYYYKLYKAVIQISPGAVNFVTFRGSQGFVFGYPEVFDPAEFLQ